MNIQALPSCAIAVFTVVALLMLYSFAVAFYYKHKPTLDRRQKQTRAHPNRRAEDKITKLSFEDEKRLISPHDRYGDQSKFCRCPACSEARRLHKAASTSERKHIDPGIPLV